jgi:hypothetical protein
MIEIVRRTKAGRTDILPTTHFSYFLTLGLKLFVVGLIYSIPVIILSCILGLMNSSVDYSDSNVITIVYTSMGCFGSLLTFVVQVAVSLLGTYGIIKLAETDQIKACLDFNDAFNTIKNNLKIFILVELLAVVAGLIGSVGVVLCFIGVLLTAPYGIAVTGNLVGQLWNNLKSDTDTSRPWRGTVNQPEEDVIEEAPFTKVDDIEKEVSDISVEPKNEEIIIDVKEPVVDNTTVTTETEGPVEAAPEAVEAEAVPVKEETVVEETAKEDVKVAEETVSESHEEEKPNTDIPSFE